MKFKRASNGWSFKAGRYSIHVFRGMRAARFSWERLHYGSSRYINVCWARPGTVKWWARSVYLYY